MPSLPPSRTRHHHAIAILAALSPTFFGCSGADSNSIGAGGNAAVGGNSGTSSGGSNATGGSAAGTPTAGATNTGGITGAQATGGKTGTSTAATGGAATSGTTATGGAATGGKTNGTGGTTDTGGAVTGGKSATGGTTSTGVSTGGAATGGKSSTGGAATGGAATGGTTSTGGLPRLTVNGNKLQDPTGKTIILRGSSLIDIGSLYAYFGKNTAAITSRMDKIATASVQGHVVRLPAYPKIDYNAGTPACSPYPYPVGTGPSTSCTPSSPVTPAEYYTNILKPAVDYATSKNLYVIIDYHQIDSMTGTGSTASTSAADSKTFWTDIAPKFASYTNVFYEIFNEPIDNTKTWATIKPVVQDIITTVRAAAPQNIIIVPSNNWDQKPGDATSDPPTGGNLMYTAHIYPSNWTSTGAFQTQVTTACSKAPVFITEWGYSNTDANYATFASTLQTAIDNEGASWTAWVTDNSWSPTMFSDTNITQLTTFGNQVKTWLAAKATSDWVL